MKKFFLIVVGTIVLLQSVQAQRTSDLYISSNFSNFTEVMLVNSLATDSSYSYALISQEFSHTGPENNYNWIQLIEEFKFWNIPLFVHTEYRATNGVIYQLYLGLSYNIYSSSGLVSLGLSYRNTNWNKEHAINFSVVTNHDWGWINLQTFTDLYKGTIPGFFSEWWIYFPVLEKLDLGLISEMSYEKGNNFWYRLSGGFKYRF